MTDHTALIEALERKHWVLDINGMHEEPVNPDGPDAAATITALQAEVAALREALTLAANRMDVMALAVIHENTTRRYEWHEWAIAARDALGGAA